MNRPFYSTNSNIYDESTCSSAPMNLVGQNVIVSQGQQRQVYDTFNTSVVGVNQNQMPANYPIQCQKQCVPGGVTFSFQTQNQGFVPQVQQPMQNPYCPCNTNNSKSMTQQDYPQQRVPCYPSQTQNPPIQYHQQQQQYLPSGAMSNLQTQMAWSEFQRQALEYDRLMRKNPFQLTFHQDSTTNTDDLLNCTTQVPPSRGLPDFSNICGVVPPDFLQADSTMKKLMLKEPPSPVQGHVADILDPPPKQVSFCEAEPAKDESPKSTRTDFQCQVDTPCRCESTQVTSMETFWFSAEDAEHFGSRDRSRSARESTMNEEFSSDDEDRPKRPPRNKRKKRMNCRRNNRRRRRR